MVQSMNSDFVFSHVYIIHQFIDEHLADVVVLNVFIYVLQNPYVVLIYIGKETYLQCIEFAVKIQC